MRLGDLDALKKELYIMTNGETGIVYTSDVINLINNAPTVETDIEVVAKEAYKQGYTDGWKERFGEPNERPQGEWELIKENKEQKSENNHGQCFNCKDKTDSCQEGLHCIRDYDGE